MGIALDLLAVLTVAAAIARGWKRGFIFQAAQLSMLLVVYFIARAIANGLDRTIASAVGISPITAGAIAFLGGFIVLAIVGTFVIGIMLRELGTSDGAFSQMNRFAGTALGGSKGLLVSYAIIAGLIQLGRSTDFRIPWQSSIAGRWVAEHNILDRGEVGALAKLVWLVSTRDLPVLMDDPRFQLLMNHPTAAVFTSPELLASVGSNDWVTLMANEKLWVFLQDPEVQAVLATFTWGDIDSTAKKVESPKDDR